MGDEESIGLRCWRLHRLAPGEETEARRLLGARGGHQVPRVFPTQADEFLLLDLRDPENCRKALTLADGGTFDEVYQLAADMGGMGFISVAECEVLHNNALINIHMAHTAAEMGVPRYFFSSSVCVYRDMEPDEPPLTEEDAIPANPDNEYGWEKLYAERVAMAYGRRYGMKVRIARFENCYGPEGTWRGGREKAPAAICRKVARRRTAEPLRCGAMGRRSATSPTWTTWWKGSTC
jgi:GDP-D-mannose 3',5'-epimerase